VAQVRALVEIPSGGATDSTVILGLATTGTSTSTTSSELWEVRYKTGGALNVRGWSRGSLIVDSTIAFAIDGRRGILGLLLTQNGANIDWRVDFLGDDRAGVTQYSTTFGTSYTFGAVTRVQINTDGGNADVAVGHVALYRTAVSIFANSDELLAFDGDSVTGSAGRLVRLCSENDVGLTRYTIPQAAYQLDDMGSQSGRTWSPCSATPRRSTTGSCGTGRRRGWPTPGAASARPGPPT
jgi:hypothetical protein